MTKPRNWVKYSPNDDVEKERKKASVSITKDGHIAFSVIAVQKYVLKSNQFVSLYYDVKNKVVGLELTKRKNNYTLSIRNSGRSFYVRSKKFWERNRIHRLDVPIKFELKKDANSGFLYFELKKPTFQKDWWEREKRGRGQITTVTTKEELKEILKELNTSEKLMERLIYGWSQKQEYLKWAENNKVEL